MRRFGRSEIQNFKKKPLAVQGANRKLIVREIQICELAVELFCGGVIGLGGGGFCFEVAEVDSFSVADDGGPPESFIFIEPDAFIAGARASPF